MQQTNKPCQSKGRIQVRVGVKQIQMGNRLQYAILITNDSIQILDLLSQDTCAYIRIGAYPRSAKLSKCEKFIVAAFTDNSVGIFRTVDGTQISKILGIPRTVNSFVISGNSKRLLFANNNTLCLWSIPKGDLQITSQQWKNINCYAISDEGNQISIGTYSGAIVILTLITTRKVTQMQYHRHKNCVRLIAYSKNKIVSISHDQIFLTTTITSLPTGQKAISYQEILLQSIPRSIESACGITFFTECDGSIGWISKKNKLIQYSDGLYGVSQYDNSIMHIRYKQGLVQWFQK